MEIIEIKWEGPYSIDGIKGLNGPTDYGLYQVYGAHNVYGSDTLLYIGKANDQTFAQRIRGHREWIDWQSSPISIYVGRLAGVGRIANTKWRNMIDNAEKLLIYFSSPPYNSQHLNSYGEMQDTMVLNFGKKNRLPFEYSTYWNQSKIGDSKWQPFKYEGE